MPKKQDARVALLWIYSKIWKLQKYRRLTRSSEASGLMEGKFWRLIKSTCHAFPPAFCLSLDVTWSVLLLNLLFRHAYTKH